MRQIALVLQFIYIMLQNIIGVVFWPYATYFKLTHEKTPSMGIVFLLLVPLYAVAATIIKNGLFHTDLLFIFSTFFRHTFAIWTTFLLSFVGFIILSELRKPRVVNAEASADQRSPTREASADQRRNLVIFTLWAFSYLPTYVWFSMTALLYFLLPPPRTSSFLGQSFSAAFIAFSLFVLLWKMLLYYLTLRIGLKMTLFETVLASVFLFPLFSLFSFISYKMGIFRVPFV